MLMEAGFSNTFIRILTYGVTGNTNIKFDSSKNLFEENNLETQINSNFIYNTIYVMKLFYVKIILFCVVLYLSAGYYAFQLPISQTSSPELGWIVWVITLIALPILIFGGVFSNILQGLNRIPELRLWETFFNFLSSITSILILLYFPNVFFLVLSVLFWGIMSVFRNAYLAKKLGSVVEGKKDIATIKYIKKNSIENSIKSGLGVVFSQGITYVVGFIYASMIDSKSLAMYLITVNIILNIRNFSQAPFYSKLPLFSSLVASGDLDSLRTISQRSMRLVYLIFILSTFSLFLLGQVYTNYFNVINSLPDIHIWTVVFFAFFLERFGAMHIQLYSTSNHILWHIQTGVSGLITILFTYVLFNDYSYYSYPIGLIASNILFYSWYGPYHSYRFLQTTFWSFEKRTFFPFLICSLILLIGSLFL